MSHVAAAYFAEKYAEDPDPWGFDSRWYEARKYALTVASLPRERYRRAFEPGCANGALTEKLAARCDRLFASEMMPEVAARARTRLATYPNVQVSTAAIPEQWPDGAFDLIVLSEVAYYLTNDGFSHLLAQIDAALEPAGHVVAVHWTGVTDYPIGGAEVHARLAAQPNLRTVVAHRDEEFLLSVLERSGA